MILALEKNRATPKQKGIGSNAEPASVDLLKMKLSPLAGPQ